MSYCRESFRLQLRTQATKINKCVRQDRSLNGSLCAMLSRLKGNEATQFFDMFFEKAAALATILPRSLAVFVPKCLRTGDGNVVSVASPSAAWPITSDVAGLITGNVAPDFDGTKPSSIQWTPDNSFASSNGFSLGAIMGPTSTVNDPFWALSGLLNGHVFRRDSRPHPWKDRDPLTHSTFNSADSFETKLCVALRVLTSHFHRSLSGSVIDNRLRQLQRWVLSRHPSNSVSHHSCAARRPVPQNWTVHRTPLRCE